jgi:hypothetical protein
VSERNFTTATDEIEITTEKNEQKVNTEQEGSGRKEVSVSERNFTTATDEIEINAEKVEQEARKSVAMEQDLTTHVTVVLGVGSFIIVIGVVLVVAIIRRRRRTGKFFPNIEEITLCHRRKQVIPTEC